jgi:uncharacterized membrane protein
METESKKIHQFTSFFTRPAVLICENHSADVISCIGSVFVFCLGLYGLWQTQFHSHPQVPSMYLWIILHGVSAFVYFYTLEYGFVKIQLWTLMMLTIQLIPVQTDMILFHLYHERTNRGSRLYRFTTHTIRVLLFSISIMVMVYDASTPQLDKKTIQIPTLSVISLFLGFNCLFMMGMMNFFVWTKTEQQTRLCRLYCIVCSSFITISGIILYVLGWFCDFVSYSWFLLSAQVFMVCGIYWMIQLIVYYDSKRFGHSATIRTVEKQDITLYSFRNKFFYHLHHITRPVCCAVDWKDDV